MGSLVNMIGEPNMNWDEHESSHIHFENEQDIHTNSEIYEANGYMHDLELRVISH